MSTAPMRHVELVLLSRDLDPAIEELGRAECFEQSPGRAITEPGSAPSFRKAPPVAMSGTGATQSEKLRVIRRTLGLEYPADFPDSSSLPSPDEEAELDRLYAEVLAQEKDAATHQERVARTRELLDEARSCAGLRLPFGKLDSLSFLSVRVGRLDPLEIRGVRERLGEGFLVVPVNGGPLVVAVSTRKGRFALDTELNRAGFRPQVLPPDFTGVPPWLVARLEEELDSLALQGRELERAREAAARRLEPQWRRLAASYAVRESVLEVKSRLLCSDQLSRLDGWVPKDSVGRVAAGLERRTQGRFLLRSWTPREWRALGGEEEEVPVLIRSAPVVSGFERLLLSYGTPPYGSIDPTPFMAFVFTLLFSVMFGDVGQGGLILCAGLALRCGLFASVRRWRRFAPMVIAAGTGSIVMGLLTGSCFASDSWLSPLERLLTAVLTGESRDRFLNLMPRAGSGSIFAFFGFALSLGVLVNGVGMAINIIDSIRGGRPGRALFTKTGLAGLMLLTWTVGIALRLLSGHGLAWFDGLGLGLPALGLALGSPLSDILERRKAGEGEGFFARAIEAFVSLLESVSYLISNSLSFLRVSAFALSHVVLSFIVFAMGELLRSRAPAGLVWECLVVVLGNAIILFLEGLIVVVQVIRLEYYEFLSKFLQDSGRPFRPLRFGYGRE